MCGIIGMVSGKEFGSNELMESLKRLEYRGYDSFGIATDSGLFEKETGGIKPVKDNNCTMAVAHTRWATHGGVTRENAHPHTDCTGNIFLVHNGIMSNYEEVRDSLGKHDFKSETDTEVIAHFFEETLKTKSVKEAVTRFFQVAKGEFAIVMAVRGDKNLYAMKRGSPLSLGLLENGNMVASDIYAFSDKTENAIFFNENEFAVISASGYDFYRFRGNELRPETKIVTKVKWEKSEDKKGYEHFMIKEIKEQPAALERLKNSLAADQRGNFEKFAGMVRDSRRIVFVAAGTSYHATLLGVYFLNRIGVEAHTIIASEFRNFHLVDKNTLIIAVTQSGETMDVIEALHGMKEKGARIASVVNVPYSTVQRMSNVSVNIEAGQEVCVASTKSFTNQVTVLACLASLIEKKEVDFGSVEKSIKSALSNESRIKDISKTLEKSRDMYIIGRGFLYPVAREIALKVKEISYVHAEGMMGGELKHGTLALIEKDTPVIALVNGKNEIVSNAMEVKARSGRIIAVTNSATKLGEEIRIEADTELSFSVGASVVGQLLAYYIAKGKNLPIDKPRNLAKSVTVK